MKMCIGCWLEGGENFGNVLEDIKYFVENKKVLCVHFLQCKQSNASV